MVRRAFISYARQDAARLPDLQAQLRALDYDVWVDAALKGGQTWWEEIIEQIRRSDVVVVVVSTASLASRACARERGYAEALGKPILPVAIERPSQALPSTLVSRHFVDYPADSAKGAFALAAALASIPPAPALPDPLPEPPAVPLSYLTRLVDLLEAPGALDRRSQLEILDEVEPGLSADDPEERAGAQHVLHLLEARPDLLADASRRIGRLHADYPGIAPAQRTAAPATAVAAQPVAATAPAGQAAAPAARTGAPLVGSATAGGGQPGEPGPPGGGWPGEPGTPGAGWPGEPGPPGGGWPGEPGTAGGATWPGEPAPPAGGWPGEPASSGPGAWPGASGPPPGAGQQPGNPAGSGYVPPPPPRARRPAGGGDPARRRRRLVVLVASLAGVVLVVGGAFAAVRLLTRAGAPSGTSSTTPTQEQTTPTPTATATTSAPPAGPVQVIVPANQLWTDTGIDCAPGETLKMTATGTILHNVDDPASAVGPDGTDITFFRQWNVEGLPDANTASLIGSLDRANPFVVGSGTTYACPTVGRLYLGINDVGVANNGGQFIATVEVTAA
jgi:hypothetical protein